MTDTKTVQSARPSTKAAANKRASTRTAVKLAPAPKPQVEAAATQPVVNAKPKQKVVRDSFTIPKAEYAVLVGLKLRAANLKRPTKKSELLRAGVAALHAMTDKAFLLILNDVPSLKTGRPKKVHAGAKSARTRSGTEAAGPSSKRDSFGEGNSSRRARGRCPR